MSGFEFFMEIYRNAISMRQSRLVLATAFIPEVPTCTERSRSKGFPEGQDSRFALLKLELRITKFFIH